MWPLSNIPKPAGSGGGFRVRVKTRRASRINWAWGFADRFEIPFSAATVSSSRYTVVFTIRYIWYQSLWRTAGTPDPGRLEPGVGERRGPGI